jgi:hypothetical protein
MIRAATANILGNGGLSKGHSFTAEPSTTRPSALDSAYSNAALAETSTCSLTPEGCVTVLTAIRSVTERVAVRVWLEKLEARCPRALCPLRQVQFSA